MTDFTLMCVWYRQRIYKEGVNETKVTKLKNKIFLAFHREFVRKGHFYFFK